MPPRAHNAALGLHISGSRMRGFADRETGCKRKWALEYIGGIVPASSPGQRQGTALHWVGENYLRDGVPPSICPLPPAANEDNELVAIHEKAKAILTAGVPYLPEPKRPTLLVEVPLQAPLDCGGTFTGTLDFLDLADPTLPEVGDHKSTKQLRYVKSVAELSRDPQALGYGYLAAVKTGAERVAFRWVYYRTTGKPYALPVRFTLERAYLEKGWRRINEVGSEMLDLWTSKVDPMRVTPNESACNAFGGCFFKGICHGKDGKPMGASEGSAIFQQLKNKGASPSTGAAPSAPHPAAAGRTPPADDDIFGGADSVEVNPPMPPAAQAFIQAARAQAASVQKAAPLPDQLPVAEPPPAMPPAAAALASAAKKTRKAKTIEAESVNVTFEPPRERTVTATLSVVPLAVFVDCLPLKGYGAPRGLLDVFQPSLKKAAELQGVANWRLIEFGKGDGVLAACVADQLEAERPAGVVLVDSATKEGRALLGVLEQYADVFVRALR